jgi:hypothetical protein
MTWFRVVVAVALVAIAVSQVALAVDHFAWFANDPTKPVTRPGVNAPKLPLDGGPDLGLTGPDIGLGR